MPRTNSIIRPDLGVLAYEYSLGAATQGFIGHRSCRVQHRAAIVAVPGHPCRSHSRVRRHPARAAHGLRRGDWEFDFKDYTCKENGWEEPLDDTEAALFARYFDANVAVQRATLMVLRSQERRVAAKVMDTGTFKNAAVAHAWNSYADADPLADVNRAKDYFRFSVGLKPNALIMDEDVLKHISMCDAVMDRIKYSNPNAIRGELTLEQLKAYFSVPTIIVAGAVYNKAAKRRPKEIATIWPTDMIMLACISGGGPEPEGALPGPHLPLGRGFARHVDHRAVPRGADPQRHLPGAPEHG